MEFELVIEQLVMVLLVSIKNYFGIQFQGIILWLVHIMKLDFVIDNWIWW